MSERQTGPYHGIARKWLALVERRQENFIDLCETGRWRHYYTQAEFLEEMRKVLRLRDQWAVIAGVPVSDHIFDEAMLKRRSAAVPAQAHAQARAQAHLQVQVQAQVPATPWQNGFNGA